MLLEHKIEAILFFKGEPETKVKLAELLKVTEEDVEHAVEKLTADLSVRGIRLLKVGDQYELVTSPEMSEVISDVRKEELVRDLGKAGSETLAIILYRGPVSRANIDYIRGVNSSFILRNLLIRALVEKIPDPENKRVFLYQATPELLKHLGITSIEQLPGYQEAQKELDSFELEKEETTQEENNSTDI